MASGIAEFRAVDQQRVVMEARHERRGGRGPEAVRLLHHVQFGTAPEVHHDLGGARGLHPEFGPAAGVDARIRRAPNIGGGGLEPAGILCTAEARQQKYCDSNSLHQIISIPSPVPGRPTAGRSPEVPAQPGSSASPGIVFRLRQSMAQEPRFPDHWNGTRWGFSKNSRIS